VKEVVANELWKLPVMKAKYVNPALLRAILLVVFVGSGLLSAQDTVTEADPLELISPDSPPLGEPANVTDRPTPAADDAEAAEFLEILSAEAHEGGEPARIRLNIPQLPDRYQIELRLAPGEELLRAADLDLPPASVLEQIQDHPSPEIEIHAWDDTFSEASEYATIHVFITGKSSAGDPGEKLLGTVRLRLVDNDVDPAFGRVGYYRWLKGFPYDFSGLGNHARLRDVKYFSEDAKAALVFDGEEQFVRLTPEREPERADDGQPAPGSLAQYSYLRTPFQQRSISIWFNADDTYKPTTLYEEGNATNGVSLYFNDGSLFFTTAADDLQTTLEAAVDPREWIHVLAVFDHGHHRLYINGTPWDEVQGPADTVGFHPSGAFLSRGSGQGPGLTDHTGFRGLIGDVALYNIALTENHPLQVMRSMPVSEEPGSG
jgi:hypothetical protein